MWNFSNYCSHNSLLKIPKFHLISWCGSFVETHNFLRVSGDSPETLQKLPFLKISLPGNLVAFP